MTFTQENVKIHPRTNQISDRYLKDQFLDSLLIIFGILGTDVKLTHNERQTYTILFSKVIIQIKSIDNSKP